MISSRVGTAARLIVPVVGALIATNGTAQVVVHYTADDLARAPQWALAEADLVLASSTATRASSSLGWAAFRSSGTVASR
jgi:hypothetical protein